MTLGSSTQTVPSSRQCSNECFGQSIINNLPNLFLHDGACNFQSSKNNAIKKIHFRNNMTIYCSLLADL